MRLLTSIGQDVLWIAGGSHRTLPKWSIIAWTRSAATSTLPSVLQCTTFANYTWYFKIFFIL